MYKIKFVIITKVLNRQIVDQVTKITILLNFDKYSLQIITYLVYSLLFNLIIDNDVLNRDDIDLQYNREILIVNDIDISLFYNNANYIIFYYFNVKLFTIISSIKYKK